MMAGFRMEWVSVPSILKNGPDCVRAAVRSKYKLMKSLNSDLPVDVLGMSRSIND